MNPQTALNNQPLFQQAMALHQAGRLTEAANHYRELLNSFSKNSHLLSLLGTIALQMGNAAECRHYLEQSLLIEINQPYSWFYLGIAFKQLKDFTQAIECYEKAIRLKPDYAEAYCNLGNVRVELKQFETALQNFDQALAINSQFTLAHFNRGNLLRDLKRFEEAIACYQLSLQLKPDFIDAYCNLGAAYRQSKQYYQAIDIYDKALSLKPDSEYLPGQRLFSKLLCCDWQNLEQETSVIIAKIAGGGKMALPFQVLSLTDNLAIQQQAAICWTQDKFPANPSELHIPHYAGHRQIRLAYFSADFRTHPVAYLTAQLYPSHDRQKFEVFGFSFGHINDDMTKRLQAGFDQFIDIQNLSDQEVVALARKLEIDIAIDLGGHTQDCRTGIFAMRAAPIQVSFLGYAGSMGAQYMDYLIADKVVIPEQYQSYYTESIAYLPHCFLVNDNTLPVSSRVFRRSDFDLPDSGVVFCCFNNAYKINPQILDSWTRILVRVKDSVLWMSVDDESAQQNLLKETARRGINPARLVFAKRMADIGEHLARLQLADLFLDSFPYNAHSSACDALWVGLPILTRMGQGFASRVAASLLDAIGLPELVTETTAQYEKLAIELASSPEKLAAIKSKLAANRLTTALFDSGQFSRDLEAAYISMYQPGNSS
jgi:predicted O-linked N-acetylglucosamine transferase (SPINDLY family)